MSVQLFRKWQQKCICTCRVNLSFVLFIPRKKPQFEPLTPKSMAPLGSMSPPHTHSTAQLGSLSPILSMAPLDSISYVTLTLPKVNGTVGFEVPLDLESTSPQSWISPSHPSGPSERCRWVEIGPHFTLCWVGYYSYLQSQRHRWVGHHPHVYTP